MSPEELRKLEDAVTEGAVGPWRNNVEALKQAVLVIIAQSGGKLGVDDITTILSLLASLKVPASMDAKALKGVLEAHDFGVGLYKEGAEDVDKLPKIKVSDNSKDAVKGLSKEAKMALALAVQQLRALDGDKLSQTAILNALAPVLQSPAKAERAIAWAVNNSSNSAVSKLALKAGETMTWIPERDGCVHCIAYSGVRSTKTGFPKGLTYGKKPLAVEGTLPHPPLHPHCRCTVEVGITDDYAEALKREAVRSILRGFKLPTESEAVRIDAAKRLLEQDPVAPESVKKYAKSAVKRGTYKKQSRKK